MGTEFTIVLERFEVDGVWSFVAAFEVGKAYPFASLEKPHAERDPEMGKATLRCATCGGPGAHSTVNLPPGTYTAEQGVLTAEKIKESITVKPCSGCGSVELVCAWYDVEGKKHASQAEADAVTPPDPLPRWRSGALSYEVDEAIDNDLRRLRGVVWMPTAIDWFSRAEWRASSQFAGGSIAEDRSITPGWLVFVASLHALLLDSLGNPSGEWRLVVLSDQ